MALTMTTKCSFKGNSNILPTSSAPWARARPVSRQGYVVVTAFATQTTDRGASGLDVKGMRPTSPAAWEIMRNILRERKVKLLSQQELLFAQEKGVPVIDIRPPVEFETGHIVGSINIPLYRPITGWDFRKFMRRAGFAFFGVFNGTELNPDFFEDIAAAASKDKGAILVCNMGGKIEATETNDRGMQSRSLMAAYELVQMGFDNIFVLKGGFTEWSKSGRKYETEEPVEEGAKE